MTCSSLSELSDRALLEVLSVLARRNSALEAELLAHLAEVDSRELYLGEGYPSLFAYCTEVLHFSESAAYHRITAARVTRAFPAVLEAVRTGDLHLSAVRVLAPHLRLENQAELLERARHKTKRAVEALVADLAPKPDVPALVRRLPRPSAPAPATRPGASCAPKAPSAPAAHLQPLGAERYKVSFTATAAVHEKLEEARALLRHEIPDGDLAAVFDRALDALLREVRRTKFAECDRPRRERLTNVEASITRHIPAAIKRAVAERDRGACTFVAGDGTRCGSRALLEFHHRTPFARSREHRADDITLHCRSHNRMAAVAEFGPEHMARFRRQ